MTLGLGRLLSGDKRNPLSAVVRTENEFKKMGNPNTAVAHFPVVAIPVKCLMIKVGRNLVLDETSVSRNDGKNEPSGGNSLSGISRLGN